MASDKRELTLDLLARDKSGAATKSFAKNLGDAADAADKAGKATTKLGESSAVASKATDKLGEELGETEKAAKGLAESAVIAGKATDRLGDEASETKREVGSLDREIGLLEAELLVLARSFAKTQDSAERLDISKTVRKMENDLRRLNAARSRLEKTIKVPEVKVPDLRIDKKGFADRFTESIKEAVTGAGKLVANPAGLAIGGGIAAVAGPIIVSGLASAISGSIGAGVLGAGVALAVKADEGIQDAGKEMGAKFIKGLQKEATSSFAGPIRTALGYVDDAADRSVKKIGKIFQNVAPYLVPFTRDLVQAGDRIIDMFSRITVKSGPALMGLGDVVRTVTDGVADFVETIADGGPEAAANLTLLAGATADVLRYSAAVLNAFNKLASNAWVTGPLIPLLRKHYQDAAKESDNLQTSADKLTTHLDSAAKAARGERDALSSLSDELLAQNDPVFGLLNAQDKLAAAQKNVSKETKLHGANSRQTKAALRELALAALEVEGRTGQLSKSFKGKLTPELLATLRAAGLTEGQIRDLGGQFQDAKRQGDRFAKKYQANIKVQGGSTALSTLYSIARAANSLPRAVNIAVAAVNSVRRRASGGPMERDVPYWTGENGPEFVVPDAPSRVLSASASRGLKTGGGGGGGGPQKVVLEVIGQQEIVSMFRYLIRSANLLQDA